MDAQGELQPAPLAGLRVVDLTQVYSGPYCTFLLAQAGADVIKVEPPTGEGMRRPGKSGVPFAMFNANKRSIALDLKSADGKAVLEDLAASADVVVENFRPGVMEGLSLGAEALMARNPRLIYASLSGYGTTGPYAQFPALDITVQALAGVIASTGRPEDEPLKAGVALADILAGIHLYGAVVTALYRRERTGRGGRAEVAMIDSVLPALASNVPPALGAGPGYVSRTGNRHGGGTVSPYNVYPAADGYVAIICNTEAQWRDLVRVLGLDALADDPRTAKMKDRAQHLDLVDGAIREALRIRPKREVFLALAAAGVPCGAVQELPEVFEDPHLLETGAIRPVRHPEVGPMIAAASPLRFHDTATPEYAVSPPLNRDAEAILRELGRTST